MTIRLLAIIAICFLFSKNGAMASQEQSAGFGDSKVISFNKPVSGRYIKLVALSEVEGNVWASCAELFVIGKDGLPVERKGWQAYSFSSDNAATGEGADAIIDGNANTLWHTQWQGATRGIRISSLSISAKTKNLLDLLISRVRAQVPVPYSSMSFLSAMAVRTGASRSARAHFFRLQYSNT